MKNSTLCLRVFAAACLMTLAGNATAYASDFFSTAQPERLFRIGVHFGINTSNRTLNKKVFDIWNNNSWGTGIDAGATVDINFRDWFSIKPGFFYESRSGNFAYSMRTVDASTNTIVPFDQLGHYRQYNFVIPVMAVAHFNLTDDVRWNVEAGPYLQIALHNSISDNVTVPSPAIGAESTDLVSFKAATCDFGLKFGTGLTILDHYDFGIHYMAGMLHPWNYSKLGGCQKAWVFSVGYLF